MDYFKRNPNALPTLLGTLIFVGLLVYAATTQGFFGGEDKAPAPAAVAKAG